MTVRVAVAGTGRGAALHVAVIDRTPGAELIAVTSDVAGRAAAFCRDLGRPHLAAGSHASLSDLECDLIITATTPARTAAIITATNDSRTSLLIESPIGVGSSELRQLSDRAANRWVGLAGNLFHAPLWPEFLRRASTLGPLGHVGLTVTREQPAGRDRTQWPNGVLSDLIVPNLAMLSAIVDLDAVTSVDAHVRSSGAARESWTMGLHCPVGIVARVSASWSPALPFWDLQLAGQQGAVRLEFQPHPHIEDGGDDVASPTPEVDVAPAELAIHGYVQQLQATLADIADHRPPVRSLSLARRVNDIVAAAARSAESSGAATTVDG